MKSQTRSVMLPLPCVAGFALAPEGAQQGADMRHCPDLKDSRAIIRCADPGRRP